MCVILYQLYFNKAKPPPTNLKNFYAEVNHNQIFHIHKSVVFFRVANASPNDAVLVPSEPSLFDGLIE